MGEINKDRKAEIKRKEEELMDVALGLKRKELENTELKKLDKKNVEILNKRIKLLGEEKEDENFGLGFKKNSIVGKTNKNMDLTKNKYQLEEKMEQLIFVDNLIEIQKLDTDPGDTMDANPCESESTSI